MRRKKKLNILSDRTKRKEKKLKQEKKEQIITITQQNGPSESHFMLHMYIRKICVYNTNVFPFITKRSGKSNDMVSR